MTIIESKVVKRGKNNVPTPVISYTYLVNGKSYQSRRLNVGLASVATSAAATPMVARFPSGASAPAAVDPTDPSYAVLLPGVAGGHRLLVFIGSIFVLNAVIFVFLGWQR